MSPGHFFAAAAQVAAAFDFHTAVTVALRRPSIQEAAMSDQSTHFPDVAQSTVEFGVVGYLLAEHPGTVTRAEAVRYISRGRSPHSPVEADRVENAVIELLSRGVIYQEGQRLHMTGASVHLHHLLEES